MNTSDPVIRARLASLVDHIPMSIDERLVAVRAGEPIPDGPVFAPRSGRPPHRLIVIGVALAISFVTLTVLAFAFEGGRGSPAVTPPPSNTATRAAIPLPRLPAQGIVAQGSTPGRTWVAFLAMDGRVITRMDGFGIANVNEPPGSVIIGATHGSGRRGFYELSLTTHSLVPIVRPRGGHGQTVDSTDPPGVGPGGGRWAWSERDPGSSRELGQWEEQVSECTLPIAMIGDGSSPPMPVTGSGPLDAAQPSTGLGWDQGQAVVAMAIGQCNGETAEFPAGMYVFAGPGAGRTIPTPRGSYAFRMWGG